MPTYQVKTPINATSEDTAILSKLQTLYPESFKATYRALLVIRDKEFDFTGYLQYRQPDIFHASALPEAGPAVFEFRTSHGNSDVLKKPAVIKERAVIGGIMKDFRAIFGHKSFAQGRLASRKPGRRIYTVAKGPRTWELVVDDQGHLIEMMVAREDHARGYANEVEHYIMAQYKFSNFKDKIPQTFEIENFRYRFRLKAKLLSFDTLAKTKEP